jgi:hypothetical protein
MEQRADSKRMSNALIGVAVVAIFVIFASAVARLEIDRNQRQQRSRMRIQPISAESTISSSK